MVPHVIGPEEMLIGVNICLKKQVLEAVVKEFDQKIHDFPHRKDGKILSEEEFLAKRVNESVSEPWGVVGCSICFGIIELKY